MAVAFCSIVWCTDVVKIIYYIYVGDDGKFGYTVFVVASID